MAAPGVNVFRAPGVQTAAIVVGGGIAGALAGTLALVGDAGGVDEAAAEARAGAIPIMPRIVAAAATAGVAYLVTGDLRATLLVTALNAGIGLAGSKLGEATGARGTFGVAALVASVAATYLVLR